MVLACSPQHQCNLPQPPQRRGSAQQLEGGLTQAGSGHQGLPHVQGGTSHRCSQQRLHHGELCCSQARRPQMSAPCTATCNIRSCSTRHRRHSRLPAAARLDTHHAAHCGMQVGCLNHMRTACWPSVKHSRHRVVAPVAAGHAGTGRVEPSSGSQPPLVPAAPPALSPAAPAAPGTPLPPFSVADTHPTAGHGAWGSQAPAGAPPAGAPNAAAAGQRPRPAAAAALAGLGLLSLCVMSLLHTAELAVLGAWNLHTALLVRGSSGGRGARLVVPVAHLGNWLLGWVPAVAGLQALVLLAAWLLLGSAGGSGPEAGAALPAVAAGAAATLLPGLLVLVPGLAAWHGWWWTVASVAAGVRASAAVAWLWCIRLDAAAWGVGGLVAAGVNGALVGLQVVGLLCRWWRSGRHAARQRQQAQQGRQAVDAAVAAA